MFACVEIIVLYIYCTNDPLMRRDKLSPGKVTDFLFLSLFTN